MRNWPTTVVVPVPVSGMLTDEPATDTLSPTRPDDFGVKVTVRVTLPPPLRVKGNAGPLIENKFVVVWTDEMRIFLDCEFVRTSGRLALLPTATWPKDRLDGLAVTDPPPNREPARCGTVVPALPDATPNSNSSALINEKWVQGTERGLKRDWGRSRMEYSVDRFPRTL